MPTNELAPEKRIADDPPVFDDLPDLGHPPVPDPEIMENPEPVEILGHPPQTRLILDGLDSEEITAEFLLDVHDLADDHGLSVESISVGQREPDDW